MKIFKYIEQNTGKFRKMKLNIQLEELRKDNGK